MWRLLRVSGQAPADGFHPESGGYSPLPASCAHDASHGWAAALTVGLRADRDFGQQRVVSRERFPNRKLL